MRCQNWLSRVCRFSYCTRTGMRARDSKQRGEAGVQESHEQMALASDQKRIASKVLMPVLLSRLPTVAKQH